MMDRLDDHEGRLIRLEANWLKIDDVEKKVLSVENTVLKQGTEQKDLLHKLIDHHFTSKLQSDTNQTELKKSRFNTYASIFSGGGVLFLIIQWILSNY